MSRSQSPNMLAAITTATMARPGRAVGLSDTLRSIAPDLDDILQYEAIIYSTNLAGQYKLVV